MDVVTEWQVFNVSDKLSRTATGLDQLPAYFLRLGVPVFYKTITSMFNMSISTSTVPHQWKLAAIQPVPKVQFIVYTAVILQFIRVLTTTCRK